MRPAPMKSTRHNDVASAYSRISIVIASLDLTFQGQAARAECLVTDSKVCPEPNDQGRQSPDILLPLSDSLRSMQIQASRREMFAHLWINSGEGYACSSAGFRDHSCEALYLRRDDSTSSIR